MDKQIDDGGPAFPRPAGQWETERCLGNDPELGMSLRDYFAAKAMQAGIVTSWSDATPEAAKAFAEGSVRDGHTVEQHLAINAYKIADAMLQARK